MSKSLIIVTGPMRTGTTLLADLLHGGSEGRHRHPELAFANDQVEDIRELTRRVSKTLAIGQLQMNGHFSETVAQAWIQEAKRTALLERLGRRIRICAPTPRDAFVIGVKNTCLLPELVWLSQLGDVSTKFIVMFRNPIDCFASYSKRHHVIYEGDPLVALAPYLAFMNCSFMSDYFALNEDGMFTSDTLMFLKYEDLVLNTKLHLSNILKFVNLDESLYDWRSIEQRSVMTNSSYSMTAKEEMIVGAGIQPSMGHIKNVGAFHQKCLETFLTPVFEYFGYPRTQRISLTDRFLMYGDFLEKVRSVARQHDFAIGELERAVEGRWDGRVALPLHRLWRSLQRSAGRTWR